MNFKEPFGLRPFHDRMRERAFHQLRKNGNNVNAHATKIRAPFLLPQVGKSKGTRSACGGA